MIKNKLSVITKMAVFWVVAPCSLVEVYQRFRGPCSMMMEAVSTSEMLETFYQTTRRYNPEDSHLHSIILILNGKFRL
jgi:hypothetical protein